MIMLRILVKVAVSVALVKMSANIESVPTRNGLRMSRSTARLRAADVEQAHAVELDRHLAQLERVDLLLALLAQHLPARAPVLEVGGGLHRGEQLGVEEARREHPVRLLPALPLGLQRLA